MRVLHSILWLVVALAAGCWSYGVKTDYTPTADFSHYRTYAFMEPQAGTYAESLATSLSGKAVTTEVRRNLAEKGIVEAGAGQRPDFLVAYYVQAEERYEPGAWGAPGLGTWGYYHKPVAAYPEGTLVIEFLDPGSRTVFWRGTASHVVSNFASPSPKTVAAAADRILHEFPPLAVVA